MTIRDQADSALSPVELPMEHEVTDNLNDVLQVLPPEIASRIEAAVASSTVGALIEIVLDLGRVPQARFHEGEVDLGPREVSREDIAHVAARIGEFGGDNRAGIERTLHRISAIRNRTGEIVGLTCRIGRAVYGTIAILRDLIETGESLLLLGRPGVGKTTMLREIARVLAEDFHQRVIVVDTSNEIAGDGDIPHPAIGRARRMQVPTPTDQHGVMIEAVENHMPQVIVIDEIGTELEAAAARTIAERGVQLIGTAHGNTLENLMMNPTLSDLIGGIQSVTLSDEEARRRGTQKSILERKAPPTFAIIVELLGRDEVAVHRDVASTVDAILRGAPTRPELRKRAPDGSLEVQEPAQVRRDPKVTPIRSISPGGREPDWGQTARPETGQDFEAFLPVGGTPAGVPLAAPDPMTPVPFPGRRGGPGKPLRIYPFGVSRNRLEQSITKVGVIATIVRDPRDADVVMTLKNYFRTKPQPIRDAEQRGTPVFVLRSNTGVQMESALIAMLPSTPTVPARGRTLEESNGHRNGHLETALEEAEDAINAVIQGVPSIALTPQAKHVRKVQHELAERYNLGSRSRGREPHRRVEIFREAFS